MSRQNSGGSAVLSQVGLGGLGLCVLVSILSACSCSENGQDLAMSAIEVIHKKQYFF